MVVWKRKASLKQLEEEEIEEMRWVEEERTWGGGVVVDVRRMKGKAL